MAALKIDSVWLDEATCNENGEGVTLDVHMSNGHITMLSLALTQKASNPLFADILRGKCNTEPKTDGERVYWENGASLTIGEIMEMLRENPENKKSEGA